MGIIPDVAIKVFRCSRRGLFSSSSTVTCLCSCRTTNGQKKQDTLAASCQRQFEREGSVEPYSGQRFGEKDNFDPTVHPGHFLMRYPSHVHIKYILTECTDYHLLA